MNREEYKKIFTTDDAPGWSAIDAVTEKLYPDQEPMHWAATPHYAVGGNDPIDGISFYRAYYDGELYYHFVTYGFSNLYYDEENCEEEFSKWGFELTFRVKPFYLDDEHPKWVYGLLQNIARYVFKSGKWFEPYHYMPANGPIRLNTETDITGLAFLLDPEMGEIATPNGKVQFLQIYGITNKELKAIKGDNSDAKQLIDSARASNPLLITDLLRQS